MKIQIHLLVSHHLCPKSPSFPCPIELGIQHPSISCPTCPLWCLFPPPHSSTFPHKFSHLRLPSHQPSWELIKLLSLFSTSFPYFCPIFPPTLITSFLSLQFPGLLELHVSPCSWGLYADVIPSDFANNTLCMGTSSHGLCGQPNSPCFQDLRKANHLLLWVFRNPGVFHMQNSRQNSEGSDG